MIGGRPAANRAERRARCDQPVRSTVAAARRPAAMANRVRGLAVLLLLRRSARGLSVRPAVASLVPVGRRAAGDHHDPRRGVRERPVRRDDRRSDAMGPVHQTEPAGADLGTVPPEILAALDAAIKTTDFDAIRARPFTGECPVNFDGQEVIFEFGAPGGVERIASCETEIDPDQPSSPPRSPPSPRSAGSCRCRCPEDRPASSAHARTGRPSSGCSSAMHDRECRQPESDSQRDPADGEPWSRDRGRRIPRRSADRPWPAGPATTWQSRSRAHRGERHVAAGSRGGPPQRRRAARSPFRRSVTRDRTPDHDEPDHPGAPRGVTAWSHRHLAAALSQRATLL